MMANTTHLSTGEANGRYALVNGINMYYEVHGAGHPLVLIHGGGSTITTSYSTILPLLAATCQVVAVELQAHGHTSDRDAPETFEQDAGRSFSWHHRCVTPLYLYISMASFPVLLRGTKQYAQPVITHLAAYKNEVKKCCHYEACAACRSNLLLLLTT